MLLLVSRRIKTLDLVKSASIKTPDLVKSASIKTLDLVKSASIKTMDLVNNALIKPCGSCSRSNRESRSLETRGHIFVGSLDTHDQDETEEYLNASDAYETNGNLDERTGLILDARLTKQAEAEEVESCGRFVYMMLSAIRNVGRRRASPLFLRNGSG